MPKLHHFEVVSEACNCSYARRTCVCASVAALAILTAGCQVTFDKGRLSITDVPPPIVEPGESAPVRPTEELTPPESSTGSK